MGGPNCITRFRCIRDDRHMNRALAATPGRPGLTRTRSQSASPGMVPLPEPSDEQSHDRAGAIARPASHTAPFDQYAFMHPPDQQLSTSAAPTHLSARRRQMTRHERDQIGLVPLQHLETPGTAYAPSRRQAIRENSQNPEAPIYRPTLIENPPASPL